MRRSKNRCREARIASRILGLTALVTPLFASAVPLVIDDFTTPIATNANGLFPVGTGVNSNRIAVSGPGIIGGERDVRQFNPNSSVTIDIRGGRAVLDNVLTLELEYDGVQGRLGDPRLAGELGGLDLTNGGVNDLFTFDVFSVGSSTAGFFAFLRDDSGGEQRVERDLSLGAMMLDFSVFNRVDLTSVTDILFGFSDDQGSNDLTRFSLEIGGITTASSGGSDVVPVSEPQNTLLLLALGFGALALTRRRRMQLGDYR